MTEIFNDKNLWKGKYEIFYCSDCGTWSIRCPDCGNASCNGATCEKCHDDSVEFSGMKTSETDYLSFEEVQVYEKVYFLKLYIGKCLNAGFKEINWEWLHEQGELCKLAYFLFPELERFKNS